MDLTNKRLKKVAPSENSWEDLENSGIPKEQWLEEF